MIAFDQFLFSDYYSNVAALTLLLAVIISLILYLRAKKLRVTTNFVSLCTKRNNAAIESAKGSLPILYGLDISYYTGKVQAYLKYLEIPFVFIDMSADDMKYVSTKTGMYQMPAILLPDGRWMTDSTAIIRYFDQNVMSSKAAERSYNSVYPPENTALAFFSLLLEDYADEWLWKPAMHYRWSFAADAFLNGTRLATEMLRDIPAPVWIKQYFMTNRQHSKFLLGDGVTEANRAHVESIYTATLARLNDILSTRPFLLGDRPSIVDYGFFASMFRYDVHPLLFIPFDLIEPILTFIVYTILYTCAGTSTATRPRTK